MITRSSVHAPATKALYVAALDANFRKTDRIFVWLFGLQWIVATIVALVISPLTWRGETAAVHPHVYFAVVGGAALCLPVALLAHFRPGQSITRHAIAFGQVLWSSLFIHLTLGRIETHFHVFASFAFLAVYRDWPVLVTATIVVAVDHLARGVVWSESVYGVANPEWWRFLEHGGWVIVEDVALFVGIRQSRVMTWLLAQRQAELEESQARIEKTVDERTRELVASREQYRSLVEATRSIPFELDRHSLRLLYVGPQFRSVLGRDLDACMAYGFLETQLQGGDRELKLLTLGPSGPDDVNCHVRLRRLDGGSCWLHIIAGSTGDGLLRGMMFDETETHELEMQLRSAQKLESVGRLASGVAHEINTPVQFVNDSVTFVRDAFADLGPLVARHHRLAADVAAAVPPADAASPASQGLVLATASELVRDYDELDVEYLLESCTPALERAIEGLTRIADIVRSMKEFAHPDQQEARAVDINHALETTLTMARNEYKYVADIETHFGDLPRVVCLAGEMNQVFLNIIVNAAHAIGDVVGAGNVGAARGTITIATRAEAGSVVVSIGDTGGGIPETIRDRIFDPFFTTKEVGRGTGQGLPIARSVIVDKHGGELWFETEIGRGTTFFVRLPLEARVRRTSTWARPAAQLAA